MIHIREMQLNTRTRTLPLSSLSGAVHYMNIGNDITLNLTVNLDDRDMAAAGFQTGEEVYQRIEAALRSAFQPPVVPADQPPLRTQEVVLTQLTRRIRLPGGPT